MVLLVPFIFLIFQFFDSIFRFSSSEDEDQWYEVVNGVPTGGINSVDCGNIALVFALKTLVYYPVFRPEELRNLDRFVDDICSQGMWRGSIIDFESWVTLFVCLKTPGVPL